MAEKEVKGRIQQKHDIQENWEKATGFIPKIGEIIIYDADANNPIRLKIGDGVKNVVELPFYEEAGNFITIDDIDTKMNAVDPVGSGSFSFGREDGTTVGAYSVAIGYAVEASGSYSHAEGRGTTASGSPSHAEGFNTAASGASSHAEGLNTVASGRSSHAEGLNTVASGRSSHVQGESNIIEEVEDESVRGTYAHIVGNGISVNARSNAHTLDWDGNAWFAGDVYVGSTSGTNKDEGSVKLVKETDITVKYEGDKLYGLIDGAWQELVIKSQPTRASMQIAADGTSVITIPEAITSLECVDVYQNGLYLSEGINYTLDTSARTVNLIDYTADANDVFAFVAY